MRKLISLLCLLLCIGSSHAQTVKLSSENYNLQLPEGDVHFKVDKNKIVIKFKDGYSKSDIANFFRSGELFKEYKPTWHFPFPDVLAAEINNTGLSYEEVLKQVQQNSAVAYTAPVLLYGEQQQALFDQFYVKVKNAGDIELLRNYAEQLKFEVVKEYEKNIYRCRVTKASAGNSFEISKYLQDKEKFAFAEPDFIYTCQLQTVDPFYTQQWAINNTGQFSGTPGADMDVVNAWTLTTGSSAIRVAVLDCFGSVAEFNHPDLTFAATFDATGTGFNSSGFAGDAHGINCAGIISATANNSVGLAGVAYGCGVAAVKLGTITNSSGNWSGTATSISDGITWAYQNCDVTSNSNSFGSSSSLVNNAISNGLTLGRAGKGVLFLSSSGNSNLTSVSYPASNANTIAVGASSMCDERKSPTSCDGESWWGCNYNTGLDIVAPGVRLYSTDIVGANGYNTGDYMPNFNGTSSACPMAAAVVALMISRNPNITATSTRTILETNCEKVGGYTYNTGVTGQPNGTWSQEMGYGRVNAYQALLDICPPPANDNCATATSLTVGAGSCTYTNGNLCGASQSMSPATCSSFTSTSALDVWYTITPALGSITINCQSGTNTDIILGIYSGTCGTPVLLQCVDATQGGGLETMVVTGLTPLVPYYIRVYDWNGNALGTDFQICAFYNCTAPTVPVVTPAGPVTICQGQSTTLTVSNPCAGCTFNWSNGGSGTTQNISVAGSYTVTATNACGTSAASNSVTVNVNPLPVTPVVTPAGPVTICQGQSTTLTVSNPCSGCTFAWSGGGTGTTKSVNTASVNTVTATNGCGTSAASNSVTVNVNALPVTPVVTPAGPLTRCQGQTALLTVSNPCTGCTFAWSGGGTGTTKSVTTTSTNTVTATNSCGTSAASNAVSVTVNPLPVVPVVTPAGPVTICQGQSTTLTVSNPCTGCTFAWSGGGTGTTKSVNTASTNTVTSTNSCGTSAASNAVTVNVTQLPVTPIVTPAGPVSICQGQSTTLTVSNPCVGCTFAWSGGGTGTTKSVNTTSTNTVTATNSCGTSSASNAVAVNVNAVLPTISIGANPGTTICAGASVTFTANITNGGTTPAYQWRRNGLPVGTNSNTFTTTVLANNDQITCVLTSSATCATPASVTSNTLTMTVNPNLTPTITVTPSTGSTICAGTTVTFTAAITNGGSNPSYQWKKNGLNVGTNSNTYTDPALNNNDQVTCDVTSNATCLAVATVTSSTITMTVNPNLTPAVSIVANVTNPVCAGTSVTFTATPVNGGTTPFYQWMKNGFPVGTNSSIYTDNTLNTGDIISCDMVSSILCFTTALANSNTITMIVDPNMTPTISIVGAMNDTACQGLDAVFTATITDGGTTPIFQWKKNGTNVGTNSNIYTDNTIVAGDAITCELTSNYPCVTSAVVLSNAIVMQVLPTVLHLTSITATPGLNVGPFTPVTFTAGVLNGGSNPIFQWQKNGVNVGTNSNTYTTAELQSNDVVTVDVTSSIACANPKTASSNSLTMTINTGIDQVISISDFSIYPNPTEGVINIKGTLSVTPDSDTRIEIMNALGQIVYRGNADVKDHKINKQISLSSNLANGMYLLQLHINGNSIQKRFTLER